MKRQLSADQVARHRDLVAAWLSAFPGLGQLYKGHYLEATGVALLGIALAVWLGTLLCLAYAVGAYCALFGVSVHWFSLLFNPVTICLGLLPLLLFWAWIIVEAFDESDLRHDLPDKSPRLSRHMESTVASTSARPLPIASRILSRVLRPQYTSRR